MPLVPGSRLGPYEVVGAIGAGGFGEVYKARDTRLDRIVAIKLLPSADPDLVARFEREAKAVAALQHPNICTLFDVGRDTSGDYLVLEYLEGETLASRIERGPLTLDAALAIAVSVADALDKAHRAGIVHRDLKPANVMLTKSGAPKLLDFGLAKLRPATPVVSGASIAATASTPLTMKGAILGTLQYMSPEQLEGDEADARSDIFAFGATLYEMLTGRKAFDAKGQASLIGAILKDNPPPLSTTQPIVPPALDRIIQTCLAKNPDDRWQTARDLLRELRWIAESGRTRAVPTAVASDIGPVKRRSRVAAMLAALFAATTVGLAAAVIYLMQRPGDASAVRFLVSAPEGGALIGSPGGANVPPLAVSPDGRWVVFGARYGGKPGQLWLRPLDALTARPLPGTEGARFPFWSPDSRTVGFFTQIDLRKVDIAGGTAQKIADADNPEGGTWSTDGTILFALFARGLFRVAATGGPTAPVPSDARLRARFPVFLPDGRRFLYLAQGERREDDAIYAGSIDSTEQTKVIATNQKAEYASGHLLFVSGQTVMAQPFDVRTLRLASAPTAVAEPMATSPTGYASYSVSTNGVLVAGSGPRTATRMSWVDRGGKPLSDPAAGDSQGQVNITPGGDIVFTRRDSETGANGIWRFESASKRESRISSGEWAAPSPDGESIAFRTSTDERSPGIMAVRLANPGQAKRLLTKLAWPTDWSPDGRWIAVMHPEATTNFDISLLDANGDGAIKPFLQTTANEGQGRFSPDGRWIAYESDETGRLEVYLRHFPDGGQKTIISNAGGSEPFWSRRGNELCYLSAKGWVTAVSMRFDGDRVVAGAPVDLFRIQSALSAGMFSGAYTPAADGNRFVVRERVGEQTDASLAVTLNWPATLKK